MPVQRVPLRRAAVVRTTATAVAAGTACGLFWTAYHDPVAIGWPLTPFIGGFWGAVLGVVVGGAARVLGTRVLRDRSVPLWAVAVVVAVLGSGSTTAAAALYVEGAAGSVGAVAQVLMLTWAVPAVVAVVACLVLALRMWRARRGGRDRRQHPYGAAPVRD